MEEFPISKHVQVHPIGVLHGIIGLAFLDRFVAHDFLAGHPLAVDAVLQIGSQFPPLLVGVVHPPSHRDRKCLSDLESVIAIGDSRAASGQVPVGTEMITFDARPMMTPGIS